MVYVYRRSVTARRRPILRGQRWLPACRHTETSSFPRSHAGPSGRLHEHLDAGKEEEQDGNQEAEGQIGAWIRVPCASHRHVRYFACGDAPSRSVWIVPASRRSQRSSEPFGQRTSTRSTAVAAARPKWTRKSF